MIGLMRAGWWAVMGIAAVFLAVSLVRAISEEGEMAVSERDENKVRVERIFEAVEAYSADIARLPPSLSDLVPRFLALRDLEDTRGRDFGYSVVESDGADTGYSISFAVDGRAGCSLEVAARLVGWDCPEQPAE